MRTRLTLILWLLAVLPGQAAEPVITVFAAASLGNVLEEVGRSFTASTGVPVRFSFAASSALARQIESGSPADVFVSADQEWMDYLAGRNLVNVASRRDIVSNSLVLVAPAAARISLRIAPGFAIAAALGRNGRLATGDPANVPAGKYAGAALKALGVWDSVSNRIIPADNVRTALNFVALGEAPLGIVYATDARGDRRVQVVDTFPSWTHARITYPAALTTRARAEAGSIVKFLQGDMARAALDRAGFGRP